MRGRYNKYKHHFINGFVSRLLARRGFADWLCCCARLEIEAAAAFAFTRVAAATADMELV